MMIRKQTLTIMTIESLVFLEILDALIAKNDSVRPQLSGLECPNVIVDLMTRCWHQDPAERPQVSEIKSVLNKSSGIKSVSVLSVSWYIAVIH